MHATPFGYLQFGYLSGVRESDIYQNASIPVQYTTDNQYYLMFLNQKVVCLITSISGGIRIIIMFSYSAKVDLSESEFPSSAGRYLNGYSVFPTPQRYPNLNSLVRPEGI